MRRLLNRASRFARPFLKKGIGDAEVTVCIPTYQAEGFIARTLAFAQGQTLSRIRILVGVDVSTDDTQRICREIAASDSRIDIIEHDTRAGWTGNLSTLVRAVDTEFFFMFYHDDFILPQFCDRMSAALKWTPEAASANCEVRWVGETERIIPAYNYTGTVAQRVATLFAYDQIPAAPMRNMVRTDMFGADTALDEGPDGIKLHYGFLIRMMLSGPSVAVHENLYIRWLRADGMMKTWRDHPWADFHSAWSRVFARVIPILGANLSDASERHTIIQAMILRARLFLKSKATNEQQRSASLKFKSELFDPMFDPRSARLSAPLCYALSDMSGKIQPLT